MTDNSNAAPELLSCPFCDKEASIWLTEAYSCDSSEYVLGCNKCNIYTPFDTVFGDGKPTAADMSFWNTRASQAKLNAMLKAERDKSERFRAALKEIKRQFSDTQGGHMAEIIAARALAQEDE